MAYSNKAVAEFGEGWKLTKVEDMKSIRVGCDCCGASLKYAYIIEREGEKKKVGCECINKILNPNLAVKLQKGIKSVEGMAKREFERPIKQEQIKKFCYQNQDKIKWASGTKFRITHDTNPDETLKELKFVNNYENIEINFKFELSAEQIEARQEYITNKINEFINTNKA